VSGPAVRVSPAWLDLRAPADAAARSGDLVEALRPALPGHRLVVHDLGSGTGSMPRWLAPRLPGPQQWVLHDLDAELLDLAVARLAGVEAADGSPVACTARVDDVTRLSPEDLAPADLVTCSALLDVLTDDELAGLVARCVDAGCPVLLTLSVAGRVELTPHDKLDPQVAAAFDAHQRRPARSGRLLGPDAPAVATGLLRAAGAAVQVRPSPWRLGPDQAALAAEWCAGWVGAAQEQSPELAPALGPYLRRRVDQARSGTLEVTVWHDDVLALPLLPEPGR
jgi:hypothetical protein